MQDFNDKTVYITGGSSGIGLSCAQLLAQHGAHIIIFARTRERLTSALTIIEGKRVSSRQRFACQALDVTNNAMVKQVMAESVKAFGAPDILINSAGRSEPGYFEDITPEHFDATMQVNMYGIWNTIAALAPDMKKMGGVIVNVSSVAGFLGIIGYTDYCATKFAVIGFSEALRQEFRRFGIMVAVLCPPDTDTPMLAAENITKPEETKALAKNAKIMHPDDVARAMIKGIRKGRFLIIPGFDNNFFYILKRLFPSLVDFIIEHEIRKVQKNKNKFT